MGCGPGYRAGSTGYDAGGIGGDPGGRSLRRIGGIRNDLVIERPACIRDVSLDQRNVGSAPFLQFVRDDMEISFRAVDAPLVFGSVRRPQNGLAETTAEFGVLRRIRPIRRVVFGRERRRNGRITRAEITEHLFRAAIALNLHRCHGPREVRAPRSPRLRQGLCFGRNNKCRGKKRTER